MVKRRVGIPKNVGGDLESYADPDSLDGLLNLTNVQSLSEQQAPIGNDLMGTSGEARQPPSISNGYEDVRRNKPMSSDELQMRQLSQLPLAMSESDDVRMDALQNMQSPPVRQMQGAAQPQPPIEQSENEELMGLADVPSLLGQQNVESEIPDEAKKFWRMTQSQPNNPTENAPVENAPVQEVMAPQGGMGLEAVGQSQSQSVPRVPVEQEITAGQVEQYQNQFKPVEGMVERAAGDELIQSDLMRLSNLKEPIPPEIQEAAKSWEKVMSERLETLDERDKALANRMETGELTTMDKVALGLAIAIPVLMAMRYGGEAGVSSAASGLAAYAKGSQEEQKRQSEKVSELTKQKDAAQKERLDLKEKAIDIDKKIADRIPEKEAREFLKDKKLVPVGDKIGISTGDEDDLLLLDGKKFDSSKEGVARARKVVEEADEIIGIVKDSNRVVNEVIDIIDAFPDDIGVWDVVKANYGWFTGAGDKNPMGGRKLMIKVQDADGKIKEVDAFTALRQKIMNLQDVYNKQVLGGNRLTGNVVTHWGGILQDPKDLEAWLSQDKKSFKDTAEGLKDLMNSREVESLVGKGFLREPLAQAFPSRDRHILQSDENVLNQMRQNPESFRDKVR